MHDKTLAGTDGLRAGRRQWLGLAVLALSTLVVTIDVYVMLLALPHVSADLGASSIEQLWIMDIYGFVLALQRTPGFTGELTIRYEAATPLHVPLVCRVRLASTEGRKLFMTGELVAPDGTVCVRSKATFITVDRSLPWGEGV